jgi:hypothetical protein
MPVAPKASLPLALAMLLAVALVPAACSSGGAKSDAREAGHEGGADAAVDQPIAEAGDDVPPDAEAEEATDADMSDVDMSEVAMGDADVDAGVSDAEVGATEAGGDGARDAQGSDGGDGGDAAAPCPTCSFFVTFALMNEAVSFVNIGEFRYQGIYGIDLFNGSDQMVSLTNVRVRYWFSGDNDGWAWQCLGNCPFVSGGIAGIPPRGNTDSFVEFSFASGHLDAFSDTGPIVQSLSANFFVFQATLRNDYSFFPDPTSPDAHITVYVNNKLVWGVEP